MDNKELIEEINDTNNIKTLIKILKTMDFDKLDADTLAKIISILESKKELYEKAFLKRSLLLFCCIFVPLGILFNFVVLFMNGLDAIPVVDVIKNTYEFLTTSKNSYYHLHALDKIKDFFVGVKYTAFCSLVGSGILAKDSGKNFFYTTASPKRLAKYNEYRELMEVVYKSKVEDLTETLKKCEQEENAPSDDLLIDLNRQVINYIARMPKALKEKNTNSFNQMLATFYKKCKECDINNPDTPNIANDMKLAYFKELVSGIRAFLANIKPIVEEADINVLILEFTTNLNQILEMDNSKEACDAFINLSNKALDSFKNADVVTFNTILDLISEYFLLLINKDAVNAHYLIYNLNPYFYSHITDKIKQKLMNANNIETIMSINRIEGTKDLYSPFMYVEEMVQLYLSTISGENPLARENKMQTSGLS